MLVVDYVVVVGRMHLASVISIVRIGTIHDPSEHTTHQNKSILAAHTHVESLVAHFRFSGKWSLSKMVTSTHT